MLANAGAAIMYAMKDITPEIVKSVSEHLSKRAQVSYEKMEIKLKAAGYTVEQFFKSLEENSSSKEFIESYRNTDALEAQIKIICDSEVIPDLDKIELLNDIYEKEISQQEEAEDELRRQCNDKIKVIVCIFLCIGLLSEKGFKTIMLKNTKTIGKLPKNIVKKLPKK